jgi:hypothetical protein
MKETNFYQSEVKLGKYFNTNLNIMSKEDLYDKLIILGVEDNMATALCNWFSSAELEEFVEFLETEL